MERRGDIARAMFYMDVRYEGGNHGVTGSSEPNLILTDNLNLNTMNTQSSRFNVDGFDPPAGVDYFSADRATVETVD